MFAPKASGIVFFRECCRKRGSGRIGVFLWGRWLYNYKNTNVTQKVALI